MTSQTLRSLAEAATAGPWELHKQAACQVHKDQRGIASCGGYQTNFSDELSLNQANAAYIAAANPQAIIDLLDKLEAAEAKLAYAERLLKTFRGVEIKETEQ